MLYAGLCKSVDINHDVTDHDNHDHDDVYLRHEAPGGGHTLPDECLQLGALTDGGIVKQSRADLRHRVLKSTLTITEKESLSKLFTSQMPDML